MVPGTPDAAEFGLNANHRSMTKFSNADDEESKQLSCALELMIHKSGPKVEANWTLEGRMKQGHQKCCSAALCRLKISYSIMVLKSVLALLLLPVSDTKS